MTTRDFPYHLNQVPFVLNYLGIETKMLLVGGLIGVTVDETDHALEPVFGYGIIENKALIIKK